MSARTDHDPDPVTILTNGHDGRASAATPPGAGVLYWNEDGVISHANPRLAEIAGRGPEDLLHRGWRTLFGPEAATIQRLAPGETRELNLIRGDGSCRRVLLTGVFGSTGMAGMAGMAMVYDRGECVWERLAAAEAATARNENRLREAQRIGNVGSWELEIASNVVTWSEQLFRIFGLQAGVTEPSYEAFQELIHPDDRDAVVERINGAFRRGEVIEYDCRIVRPGGEIRVLHSCNELVLGDDDTPLRLIGTVQDVTERREAERALRESEARLLHAQKMEAVGRLAGGVAHDYNNLLAAVIGFAKLASGKLETDHPARHDLDRIREAADRAATLTRRLLAFSHSRPMEPRRIQLHSVIASLEPMLHVLAGSTVTLRTRFEEGDAHVCAEPGPIEQTVMNLAVNARDAMPDGGVLTIATGEVERTNGAARGRYVELLVEDTGTGMTPEVRAHLFEPFFTTKEAGRGTGLGLATVYGTIRQNGGHIEVESEVGQGTRFRILLPRADRGCPDRAS